MANVTREAFDEIHLGMWEADVKKIFGDPDDDNHEDWANYIPTVLIWENPDGSKVQVTFSHNKVTEKKYIENLEIFMQSNTQHKEYEDVDLEVILRSGNSFLPAQKIKCSLFRIYSEPSSPYSGFSKYEAMVRIDNKDIQELRERGYPIDPPSYKSFLHEGVTWNVSDFKMYQIKQENNPNIDGWDYHLNKKSKADEQ